MTPLNNDLDSKYKPKNDTDDFKSDILNVQYTSGIDQDKKLTGGQETDFNMNPRKDYIGVRRLILELGSDSDSSRYFVKRYTKLIHRTVEYLKRNNVVPPSGSDDSATRCAREVSFIDLFNLFYRDSFHFQYYFPGYNSYLWEAIASDILQMDCVLSSFFVYDVARTLNFPVKIVMVGSCFMDHLLVLFPDYAFETTEFNYYKKRELFNKYPMVYRATDNIEEVESMTYLGLACRERHKKHYDLSVRFGELAVRSDSLNPSLLIYLGRFFVNAGEYGKAYNCYERSKKVSRLFDLNQRFHSEVETAIHSTDFSSLLRKDR